MSRSQAERRGKPDARRFDQRTVLVRDPTIVCQACGRSQRQGHVEGCANRNEPWPTIEAEIADESGRAAGGR